MPEEFDCIAQTDTSGTTTYTIDPHGDALPRVLVREKPDGSLTRYVYGIGLLYEVDDNDTATFYHYDQVGSTAALTADDGVTVTDRFEYSPYGVTTYREGSTDDNGLLHMRARYYHPGIRRFINADPIGFDGGMNWYAYAGGNPVMYVDPEGTNPLLLAPLIIYGTTQVANAPGPNDPTYAEPPNVEEALLLTAAGPAAALSRTAVNSAAAGSRSFMNTLTGPTTSASARTAGTMGFADATIMTGTLARTTSATATNASQQLASQTLAYGSAYTGVSFAAGVGVGIMTETDVSSLVPSGNPLFLPFEGGNQVGSLLGKSYNSINSVFSQPTNTNFK